MLKKLRHPFVMWGQVEESLEQDPDYFKRLKGVQKPQYLYIGCADSRYASGIAKPHL